MSWESRGLRRYFYRAEKRDGRVVKTYIGQGTAGRIAAEAQAEARRRRTDRAAASRAERERLEPPARALADLDSSCSLMVEALLTLAGYHKVDSKWRKKRVPRS